MATCQRRFTHDRKCFRTCLKLVRNMRSLEELLHKLGWKTQEKSWVIQIGDRSRGVLIHAAILLLAPSRDISQCLYIMSSLNHVTSSATGELMVRSKSIEGYGHPPLSLRLKRLGGLRRPDPILYAHAVFFSSHFLLLSSPLQPF